ncbi:Uu.00g114290.m01.CDS01 [Anthostomella pinea]|uniref:Uu.00g114290.m01.CDS01 n=1 Tax=Anthostomella pinea TaxID=933095 RepID=A0AAI8YGJ1_9PEZI|nr:Uu.00g114290.m01.CDS01 [Anthostomella pinea]
MARFNLAPSQQEGFDHRPRSAPEWTEHSSSIQLQQVSTDATPSPTSRSTNQVEPQPPSMKDEGHSGNDDVHIYEDLAPAKAKTKKGRTTHRKLLPVQVVMITVNATLGTGLWYILELGGPLAVILSFLLLGILAWAVMQCITELLCIWPIPSALAVFVREFVDVELGMTVGIAYWFTYSVSFAALVAASAAEIHYWSNSAGLDAGVLYLLVPLILVVINSFGIELYGWFEVATGAVKLLFFVVIIFSMIAFADQGPRPSNGKSNWDNATAFDDAAADNWVTALFICLSTATFAYVGVEVPAACALEARATQTRRSPSDTSQTISNAFSIGETVRFASKYVSFLACIAYTLSGILVSLSIPRDDCKLPRPGWLGRPVGCLVSGSKDESTSAFVLVALEHGMADLASAFNVFLVMTALSCANTNLYVASRTLFGLTNQIDGGRGQPWYLRALAWVGRTNSHRVPIRAMALSAIAFCWVPFLQLRGESQGADEPPQTVMDDESSVDTVAGINVFVGVLAEMGSVGVLIVWACECWAFIRYYHCINKHKDELKEHNVPHVRRWDDEHEHDYPYRSNGQPVLAYLALASCLFILFVANGASLWNGFHVQPFLSSYLIVIVFLLLWATLKVLRQARWSLVDLSDPDTAIRTIRGLHQYSFAGLQTEPTSSGPGLRSSFWPLPSSIINRFDRKGREPV